MDSIVLVDTSITARQSKFCSEYVVDLNGTQAAIRAGYSPKTAKVQASRLLTKANVRARIQELQDEVAKRNEVTQDEVIGGLRRVRDEAFECGSLGTAARALELLGKAIGVFSERPSTAVSVEVRQSPFIVGETPEERALAIERLKMLGGNKNNYWKMMRESATSTK